MKIKLDYNSEKNIYIQIADSIKKQIEAGNLRPGEKLPTVRELALELNLAKGTIKHAYEVLLKEGAIDMRQGRGSFVAIPEEKQILSRKEQAMEIIDDMISRLHALNFSENEIEIYFKLKMSQWDGTAMQQIKITVVDCNPEALNAMADQIESISSVEVYKLLLEDLIKNPVSLGEEVDLVVTTHTHMPQVMGLLGEKEKALPVVLAPSPRTIIDIAKLPENASICIASSSHRFAEIVSHGLTSLNSRFNMTKFIFFGEGEKQYQILERADALVVPPRYLMYCDSEEEKAIRAFSKEKALITYSYQVDNGSMMHLKDRIQKARQNK